MADSGARFCPLCDKSMDAEVCPDDGVPTIDASILDHGHAQFSAGSLVADRYRIEERLGEGGMGSVFLANQLAMNRPVALKVLKPGLASDHGILKRFYREARAISALEHPNIVRVFDFGVDTSTRCPFLAMEYVKGATLKGLIRAKGPLPEARAAALLAQVAKALVEAHEKGIVHRDLKPDNILVRRLSDGDEHVKVVDFGVAKILHHDTDPHSHLTKTGAAIGTPLYMSPEQISGERVGFRTDLYSLGCVLHFVLSGHPPFVGEQVTQIMMRHLHDPLPGLPKLSDGSEASDALAALHKALLQKRETDRPGDTAQVARILSDIARGVGDTAERAAGLREAPQVSVPPPATSVGTDRSDPFGDTLDRSSPEEEARAAASMELEGIRAEPRPLWPVILISVAAVVFGGLWLATSGPQQAEVVPLQAPLEATPPTAEPEPKPEPKPKPKPEPKPEPEPETNPKPKTKPKPKPKPKPPEEKKPAIPVW